MENEKKTPLSFGVDLNEKEYIIFQRTVSKFSAAKRLSGFFLLGLALFAVFMITQTIQEDVSQLFSADTLSLLVFTVLSAVSWLIVPPLLDRIRFKKGYADAIAGGQVFEGMVTVTEESITKVTPSGTLTLPFDNNLLFVERKDMMFFVNRFGQGIVLPARCMTAEDAAVVREVAQASVYPRFFMVKGSFAAARTERMTFESVEPVKTLYTVNITYNGDEQRIMIKTLVKRDVSRTVPSVSLLAFLFAACFGWSYGFWVAAIIFGVSILLFAGIKCLFWLPRYKAAGKGEAVTLSVLFTEQAVVMEREVGQGKQRLILRWKDVAHAVESENAVEIYDKKQYMYIPKRHIGDMDFLRQLVNEKMKRNARERNE